MQQLTQTVSQKKPTASSDVTEEVIGKYLERNGWLRKVAGNHDFLLVCRAIKQAHDAGRGLFIAGKPGCGKTALLEVLRKNYRGGLFYCKESADLQTMRNIIRDPNFYLGDTKNIFIDDLGCEEIVKEYGNTVDIVGDFIQTLHNRFKGRVFISSNNGLKWMNERYGGRVMDRVLGMCVCFQMEGGSKRERMIVS